MADRYHHVRPRYHLLPFEWILTEQKRKYERALDVACGTGHASQSLKILAREIVGMDHSAGMLRVAKDFLSIPFVRADASVLPFADGSFDFINISMAFHWLDQARFLTEAARVLSPQGQFCINTIDFCGQLSEQPETQKIYTDFLEKYMPQVQRKKGYPNQETRDKHQLSLDGEIHFSQDHTMDADDFVSIATTWSNYQVLSESDQKQVEKLMRKTCQRIFQGGKLTLKFNGKARLYSFATQATALSLDELE